MVIGVGIPSLYGLHPVIQAFRWRACTPHLGCEGVRAAHHDLLPLRHDGPLVADGVEALFASALAAEHT